MTDFKVSFFVLNYNGAQLLPECLPSILRSTVNTKYKTQLLVIDNQSTDSSLEVLRNQFPDIPVLSPKKNRYLCSFNEYVFTDRSDVVVLMNNDIKVEEDFLDPLVQLFEKKDDAFMASSLCWDFSKKGYEGGLSVLIKKYGWWGTCSVNPFSFDHFPYTASIGACIAFRRDRFVELGGYDDLFLPGTLEDLDICYRGWREGWKGYFVKESVIYHKGQATFKEKFGAAKIRELATRNTFLFTWKNVHDPRLLLEHFVWIPARLLYALLRFDFPFLIGCFKAFLMMPRTWQKRAGAKHSTKLTDREIIDVFKPLLKGCA